MNILQIKGSEVFKLENVLCNYDSAGKECIVCNYSLCRGPKGSLKVIFEGCSPKNCVRIKDKYTFKSLMKMFYDRRIYLNGVTYLDGQFSADKEV